MRTKKSNAKFKVGDHVRFDLIRSNARGVIVEDRGRLGVNGTRLYMVSQPSDPFEPERRLLSEDRLELDLATPDPLQKAEIIKFLKHGGLVWILLSNPSEKQKDPRVWLCHDQLGGITFTFSPDRGMVGGSTVPFSTFWLGDGIHAPRRDEVARFLLSFGLTPEEAEDVIRAVGVSPVSKRRRKVKTA